MKLLFQPGDMICSKRNRRDRWIVCAVDIREAANVAFYWLKHEPRRPGAKPRYVFRVDAPYIERNLRKVGEKK